MIKHRGVPDKSAFSSPVLSSWFGVVSDAQLFCVDAQFSLLLSALGALQSVVVPECFVRHGELYKIACTLFSYGWVNS